MIRIGISGWRYAPWRGVWYPEALARRRELEFCGHHFPTVEINGSLYSLQRPESYDAGSSARRFSSRPRLSREGRGNDLVHGLFTLILSPDRDGVIAGAETEDDGHAG